MARDEMNRNLQRIQENQILSSSPVKRIISARTPNLTWEPVNPAPATFR